MLGLTAAGLRPGVQPQPGRAPPPPSGPAARFLLPVQNAEVFSINQPCTSGAREIWELMFS
jgi:protein transport protein SEC23